MWKRKDLKSRAKQSVKKNYWTAIVVCFVLALFTGEFGNSILGLWQSEDSIMPNYLQIEEMKKENKIIEKEDDSVEYTTNEGIKKTIDEKKVKVLETINANLNSLTKTQKYALKIWDAIVSFNMNKTGMGVTLSIAAIISFCITLFIANPLIVGGKRYFIKATDNSNIKISVIIDIFKDKNWIHIAITMLLRNIYNTLWYITIIGGFIKNYEYRMIPYILADNPKIKRKEAFKLSKQMMKGNKWRTFILDMSFLGWNILSVLTHGILSILYVNPYNAATIAELYLELKKQAIENKYEYYNTLIEK